jgi:DNA primase
MYDRFRDRVMFRDAICNDLGDVVAFSGRVLQADAPGGKYVNSPETPIFTKGSILFGLHRSKRPIIESRQAVVCEGQLDLISAFEAGVTNIVAPQGTAFTPRQAQILRRHADEAILCFDADTAGRKAAERAFGPCSRPASWFASRKCPPAKIPTPSSAPAGSRRSGNGSAPRAIFSIS